MSITTMTESLKAICRKTAAPQEFTTWLEREEIFEPIDLALMAAKEEDVQTKIIDYSALRGLRTKHRFAITKAWLQCKALKDREVARRSGTARGDEEDPIDEQTRTDLNQEFHRRHGLNIGTHRLVAEGQFGKVYRATVSDPPRFVLFVLEKICLLNAIDPKKGQVLLMQPGRMPEVEEVVAPEEVRSHHELWLRVRALFTSIAVASIMRPSFFSFQDCEFFFDLVLTYLYQRFDNSMAPASHYISAYLKTMQVFQSEVVTNGKTLKKIVHKTATWQHFWTVYQKRPISGHHDDNAARGSTQSSSVHPDASPDLQAELDRTRKLMVQMQSKKDKEIADLGKTAKVDREPQYSGARGAGPPTKKRGRKEY